MPNESILALQEPQSCDGISAARRAELYAEAEKIIYSKDEPFVLTSCAGLLYFVQLTIPQLLTYGRPVEPDTKWGYSALFVIRPDLLDVAGLEQLYRFISCVRIINQLKLKGKAEGYFLKEGEEGNSIKPYGSLWMNVKKQFATEADCVPPRVYARDGKTLVDVAEVTEGSLVRLRIYAGTPSDPKHGKRIWGGSIEAIHLLCKNEGQVETHVTQTLAEECPEELDNGAVERFQALGTPALPAPVATPAPDGATATDMDDDIPF